jgi:hypothetical protein
LPLAPCLAIGMLLLGAAAPLTPSQLWGEWPARRFVATPAPCLRHADLDERIRALEARHEGRLDVEVVGRSVEGRDIHLLRLGHGARRVLLWSQMHGDEPSATPALLDVADTLLSGDPEWNVVLERLTLLMVPMLNPDGAERYVRRNAQAIDINRDALVLATPEGRLLKGLRERFRPELGFNLHDQDRRTTVGETGVLATVALLAVAGDAAGTLTPGRERAKRVCARLVRTLEPFFPGGVSRYDEDWNPRAFGDNLTAWGTPVVLLESGGVPPGLALTDLTRLNYVGLLTVLRGLATDDLAGEDPSAYERLPRNDDGYWVDGLVVGGRIWQPPVPEPYPADVAFDVLDEDPTLAACPGEGGFGRSRIREVGDGRLLHAARRFQAAGRLIAPALAASVHGLEAEGWLSGDTLRSLAALGVARLRWHVEPRDGVEARGFAEGLAAPGAPAIDVQETEAPAEWLEVPGPPAAPKDPSLGAALDALTGGSWRARREGRPLGALLPRLVGLPEGREAVGPPLHPDAPASFLVLRPREGDTVDVGSLDIETVFVDGRPAARSR